jgi:hypothetical protein
MLLSGSDGTAVCILLMSRCLAPSGVVMCGWETGLVFVHVTNTRSYGVTWTAHPCQSSPRVFLHFLWSCQRRDVIPDWNSIVLSVTFSTVGHPSGSQFGSSERDREWGSHFPVFWITEVSGVGNLDMSSTISEVLWVPVEWGFYNLKQQILYITKLFLVELLSAVTC